MDAEKCDFSFEINRNKTWNATPNKFPLTLFLRKVLVGKALQRFGREKFVVATKFGIEVGAQGIQIDSSKAKVNKITTFQVA